MFSERTSKILIWLGIILFIGCAFFFFLNDLIWEKSPQIDSRKLNDFGTFIGGLIGTLWALAGVVLFYVALTEQRRDIRTNQNALKTQVTALEQQIKEFELQRKELELTREVFTEQSKTMKSQRFESTFFNSLDLLNNIIENISVTTTVMKQGSIAKLIKNSENLVEYIPVNGRDCFSEFYITLREHYESNIKEYRKRNNVLADTSLEEDIIKEILSESYKSIFLKHQSKLGHYFRTIYNIIKLVDERGIDNPKYYTNLVRAQLSSYEHLLLFYNCLSEFGKKKFYPLVIKYSLLDNLPKDLILDERHKEFYPSEAYE